MNAVRSLAFLAIAIALSGIGGLSHATAAFAVEAYGKPWSFSASAYTYFVPDSRNYVQPTVTADRRWLHLEARYNYEGMERTLDSHIRNLRRKIESDPSEPMYIKTVFGVGYRLRAG